MSIKARDLEKSKGEYLEATMRSPVILSPVITICTEKTDTKEAVMAEYSQFYVKTRKLMDLGVSTFQISHRFL